MSTTTTHRSLRTANALISPVSRASLLALASTLLVGACASTGGARGSEPVELSGSTWQLPATASGLDGRTVRFHKVDGDRYVAVLKDVGRQLESTAGAYEGAVMMDVVLDPASNTLSGLERLPGQAPTDILCSVFASGREMKCNNANTVWERQPQRARLAPASLGSTLDQPALRGACQRGVSPGNDRSACRPDTRL
jgi:hypothetical protein